MAVFAVDCLPLTLPIPITEVEHRNPANDLAADFAFEDRALTVSASSCHVSSIYSFSIGRSSRSLRRSSRSTKRRRSPAREYARSLPSEIHLVSVRRLTPVCLAASSRDLQVGISRDAIAMPRQL